LSAKRYAPIKDADDWLNIAVAGLEGKRVSYNKAISLKENNVNLIYLCDLMKSQSGEIKLWQHFLNYSIIGRYLKMKYVKFFLT
jgi:hypothetical protein